MEKIIGDLVLIRHGQSEWNSKNLFTGWHDIDLTEKGIEEARNAGKLLKDRKLKFNLAFTSVLSRAIHTLFYILKEMELDHIPIKNEWMLNERHYGSLQGLNKLETTEKYGENQVNIWRRSFDIAPPKMSKDDPRHPLNNVKYNQIDRSLLPGSESLKETLSRVKECWNTSILPELNLGKNIIITAHGNSLRALAKIIENISDKEISEFNIPTGVPRYYKLDKNISPISVEYLGNKKLISEATKEVAQQSKK
ncbi:MAG: phosphoglyceromutase [Gammaproteobacteria bacterium TMED78]|nr:MAG: phosphoglyceromutase [Gammaproteobacteria bacterium TMED78]|tara:strand:+ start:68299 stop:69054 length:756 start_codon:yes stop_codon:yes gene_type:complete